MFLFKLRSACILACIISLLPLMMMAQGPLGNNEIVFVNADNSDAQFDIFPKGFIFNNELIYHTHVVRFDPVQEQLLNNGNLARFNGTMGASESWGFESPWASDEYVSTAGVTAKQMLGFGEYTIKIGDIVPSFTLNLIDANWHNIDDNQVVKFVFTYTGTSISMDVYHDRGGPPIYQTANVPSVVNVWDYTGMPRERTGKFIDGSNRVFYIEGPRYTPIIPIPSTNVTNAKLDVNTELWGDVALASGATIDLHVANGESTKLKIIEQSTLTCEAGSVLRLSSGVTFYAQIEFMGGPTMRGKAIMHHPLILRGEGELIRTNIEWTTNFQIDDQSDFSFRLGGTFTFTSANNEKNIYLNGTMRFYDNATYNINAETIYAQSPNTPLSQPAYFLTNPGVQLSGLNSVQGLDNSIIRSDGAENDPCEWNFNSMGAVDIYDVLEGNYTTFRGGAIDPMNNHKWQGILLGYELSVIDFDHCVIKDIHTDSLSHGSAVHFYGSQGIVSCHGVVHNGNEIDYSHIIHDESDVARTGDGIFLQPDFNSGDRSYLRLWYSCIFDHWFTGLTNVESTVDMVGNAIFGGLLYPAIGSTQNRGVGGAFISNLIMADNCIRDHAIQGLYTWEQSETWFYRPGISNEEGHNAITDNGPPTPPTPPPHSLDFYPSQIVLASNSSLTGGYVIPPAPFATYNNISHWSSFAKRAYLDNSDALMERNWWGEQPADCNPDYGTLTPDQENRFFTLVSSTLSTYQAKCSVSNTRVCGGTCPEGSGIIITAPPSPQPIVFAEDGYANLMGALQMHKNNSGQPDLIAARRQFLLHAGKNEIDNAYNVVAHQLLTARNASTVASVCGWALHLELERGRKNIEPLMHCLSRVVLFLSTHQNLVSRNDVKAPILYTLGHAYGAAGDYQTVDQIANELQTRYPNSEYALKAIDLMQLAAMARRDTVAVDHAIAQLTKAGVDAEHLRTAQKMRLGFLRAKPRGMVSRRVTSHPKLDVRYGWNNQAMPSNALGLRNFPNPFSTAIDGSPSTIIEFTLPRTSRVVLKLYSMLGSEVATIMNEERSAGKHFIPFDTKMVRGSLPPGIYFYTLTTDEQVCTGKMNIIR